jgi:uncharacterized protein YijF (DUF1287 family)
LNEKNQKRGCCSADAAAAVRTWQLHVYRKVDREMGLAAVEFDDEMKLMRTLVDVLRTFRRRLYAVRFD